MKKSSLTRLQAIDSQTLAQALFDLAKQSEEASTVVDRLTRTTAEAHQSVKRAISSLTRSSRYIDWRNVDSFVRKLNDIVDDIAQIDITAEQRLDLICRFYETDESTFERVDDSSGFVGDVYTESAHEVFCECANAIAKTDQPLIAKSLERLLSSNDYGVRDSLLADVVNVLDESTNRELVVRFSTRSDQEADSYVSDRWLRHVMTIASYLGDTRLFEITALEAAAEHEDVPTSTKFAIASNYFNHKDIENAKRWMDEIDVKNGFMQTKCNQLLLAIYEKLGNTTDRDRVALEEFHRAPSITALNTLIAIIGEQSRSEIVNEQVEAIFTDTQFSEGSLDFLVDTGFQDLAADYTIRHRSSINGDHYWQLPKHASNFSKSDYPLAGICIYRALLNSILRRGNTKAYYYGVRYLAKLDELSETKAAQGMDDHVDYKKSLIAAHGKKRSFWAKYDAYEHVERV